MYRQCERYKKTAKPITEKPQNDAIPSWRSTNAFRLKQEIEEVTKVMSSVTLNDISGFSNLIKASAVSVCEIMVMRKSVKSQRERYYKTEELFEPPR